MTSISQLMTVCSTYAGKRQGTRLHPLPMLAGPGAISTSLILLNQARGLAQHIALFASILVVSASSYWIFWLAAETTY